MVSSEQQAMVNRAVRSIRNELEYLSDLRIITPQQLSSILAQVPTETPLNAHLPSPLPSPLPTNGLPAETAQPSHPPPNEKQQQKQQESDYFAPSPVSTAPPPAYVPTLAAPSLAVASATYEYKPSDAGDLALLPGDRISITEFMNADWAKGRNERTGLDGIFPRSYVAILADKDAVGHAAAVPPRTNTTATTTSSNYGNLPLEVSQSGGSSTGKDSSKLNQNGKKFGKKLGNATIFGAGATIGSNIVNGIF